MNLPRDVSEQNCKRPPLTETFGGAMASAQERCAREWTVLAPKVLDVACIALGRGQRPSESLAERLKHFGDAERWLGIAARGAAPSIE